MQRQGADTRRCSERTFIAPVTKTKQSNLQPLQIVFNSIKLYSKCVCQIEFCLDHLRTSSTKGDLSIKYGGWARHTFTHASPVDPAPPPGRQH